MNLHTCIDRLSCGLWETSHHVSCYAFTEMYILKHAHQEMTSGIPFYRCAERPRYPWSVLIFTGLQQDLPLLLLKLTALFIKTLKSLGLSALI